VGISDGVAQPAPMHITSSCITRKDSTIHRGPSCDPGGNSLLPLSVFAKVSPDKPLDPAKKLRASAVASGAMADTLARSASLQYSGFGEQMLTTILLLIQGGKKPLLAP